MGKRRDPRIGSHSIAGHLAISRELVRLTLSREERPELYCDPHESHRNRKDDSRVRSR